MRPGARDKVKGIRDKKKGIRNKTKQEKK